MKTFLWIVLVMFLLRFHTISIEEQLKEINESLKQIAKQLQNKE